jgi:hypothetical protein
MYTFLTNTTLETGYNIRVPNMTMAKSQNCNFYEGMKTYNNFSEEIRNSSTIKECKIKLNDHLRLESNDL